MLKDSLKEYFKASGKWGWVVLTLIIGDAVGIIQSYFTNLIVPNWAWWLFLAVILIVSPFLAFHKLRLGLVSMESDLKRIQDARPSIEVTPEKQTILGGEICYLKVHNNGAEGTFRAQVELSSDDPSVHHLPNYNGSWKYSDRAEAKILRGHNDLLKIAEIKSSPPHYDVIRIGIFFYDASEDDTRSISASSHWIGATINGKPMSKFDYQLRVTIGSSPELREGTFCKNYILNVDGLRESTSIN